MQYWVYVYELHKNECVRACRGKPCRSKSGRTKCLYVGSSYLTPAKRMSAHHKHSRHLKARYRMRYDLMPRHSFSNRHEAERAEHALAMKLRKRYTVFQG